jgi:hypothetical protein
MINFFYCIFCDTDRSEHPPMEVRCAVVDKADSGGRSLPITTCDKLGHRPKYVVLIFYHQ